MARHGLITAAIANRNARSGRWSVVLIPTLDAGRRRKCPVGSEEWTLQERRVIAKVFGKGREEAEMSPGDFRKAIGLSDTK
jgi:hypothetical protein